MTGDVAVLVVDDEEAAADDVANILEDDYRVLTAYSGEEALEKIDASIDVVLLDRRMPGISGDEVLEQIPKEEFECRVVMVTAVDPDLDIIEMDFDEYLVKPVKRETLEEVVAQMVRRNEQDAKFQEMFAIAVKLATLESKLDLHQLDRSEQYAQLRDRFQELQGQIDLSETGEDLYLDATREKIEALLKDSH